jgi:hypothetical protein
MSYNPIGVTLASLQPFFFKSLQKELCFPNTCPEGGCQGLFTIFQASFARLWSRDAPRLLSAWR